jgi:hypothetical protein
MRRRAALVALALAGAAALPAVAAGALTQFQTPSRNIGCIGGSFEGRQFLRCDISRTTVPDPPRPRTCTEDYGRAFEMSASGRPQRLCHGDTALGGPRVLGYGRSLRIGPFNCTSRQAGLTCRNRAGHGWFMSVARITLS